MRRVMRKFGPSRGSGQSGVGSSSGLSIGLAVLALLAAGPARAAEQVTSTIVFSSELWSLNGDLARQPNVPAVQKANAPDITVTDGLTVTPNAAGVTKVAAFPEAFGGTQTISVSTTTMGNTLLVPNPINRFDPFTGRLVNVIRNQAGTAMGVSPWTARVPVDINTQIILDEIPAGGAFQVANISIPGAVGDPTVGTVMFTGKVALLGIDIEGTAFPDKFTSGTLTVMRQVITAREGGDVLGTPIGFTTFTFSSMGSVTPNKLVLITPVVIEARVGKGEQQVPAPIIGFARATNTAVDGSGKPVVFAREAPEPGVWLLAASLMGLGVLAQRRMRKV